MREGVCEHCGGVFGGDDQTPHRVWVALTSDNRFIGVYASRIAASNAAGWPGPYVEECEIQ